MDVVFPVSIAHLSSVHFATIATLGRYASGRMLVPNLRGVVPRNPRQMSIREKALNQSHCVSGAALTRS